MATDRLINSTQGDSIINALNTIAESANATNLLEISSAVVARSGYTKSSATHLFKQGQHVFGTIVFSKDSNNFLNSEGDIIADIDIQYAPGYTWYGISGFGTDIDTIKSCGHAFIQASTAITDVPGKILVTDTLTTNSWVRIQVNYIIP